MVAVPVHQHAKRLLISVAGPSDQGLVGPGSVVHRAPLCALLGVSERQRHGRFIHPVG